MTGEQRAIISKGFGMVAYFAIRAKESTGGAAHLADLAAEAERHAKLLREILGRLADDER